MLYKLIPVSITAEENFKDVFERLYPTLLLFTKRFSFSSEEADDLVQDAFVKLWELRSDFLYFHQVQSFLYSCIKNNSLNILQHQKVVERYNREFIAFNAFETDINSQIIESETYRMFFEAVETLPSRMKQVIYGYINGKTPENIAQELNISVETVYTQKKLAITRLQAKLGKSYFLIPLILPYLNN